MITKFGGEVCVPIAVRNSDSTTTIRVKAVTMMTIEGATARTVTSATSWSARSVSPPPAPRSSDRLCAAAGQAISRHAPGAIAASATHNPHRTIGR
jgi:hypothetical protein